MTSPSSIFLLARYMKTHHIESIPSLKAIVCGGETLYDWQRILIEEIFRCKLVDIYGHAEQALIAATCEVSHVQHFFPEYGILELVGKDGKPLKRDGDMGEIIGTGFSNYVFPFIRYRTGDIGVYTSKKCKCGRNYPIVKKIEGRLQELIVSKNEDLLPLSGVYGLVGRTTDNVIDCQLFQDTPGKLILNILKGNNYANKDEKKIIDAFFKTYGNEVDLSIRYVEDIPRSTRGRHKFLIQKLPIEFKN